MNTNTDSPYDDNYATCVETSARLRVMGVNLSPEAVTSKLDIDPTRTQRKGEPPCEGSKFPFKLSGWFLESRGHVESRDARRHIDWILNQVKDKRNVFEEFLSNGNSVDICCVWYSVGQGGPTLSPAQMGIFAELGIELWFDIYFTGHDRAV